ncbi:hypothetical protein DPMN_035745 [Dreissena polymorpha]|uniref:Uncharacterized protein n=1 Tax=Dreissena polymorpha TaxID=45954 RepID=A0A9D4M7V9_DREPO|nr:hypothetical protein DPMN_035745 [Dreissena polymorpha]
MAPNTQRGTCASVVHTHTPVLRAFISTCCLALPPLALYASPLMLLYRALSLAWKEQSRTSTQQTCM